MIKGKMTRSTWILLAAQLWATTPLAAYYSLDDIDNENYQSHYNRLPSIEDTDRQLKERASDFAQFLGKAEEIVVRYGMETHVGIRAVHNHFLVEKDQVMVEEAQDFGGTPSLITYAQTLEEAKEKKALPASWVFSGDKSEDAQVFETSTDPAVHAGVQMLQENPAFLNEMHDLLRATKFTSLLSVALLKRDSLALRAEESYLEMNTSELRKSIVKAWDAQKTPLNTIRTSWSFKGPKQVGGCLMRRTVMIPVMGISR